VILTTPIAASAASPTVLTATIPTVSTTATTAQPETIVTDIATAKNKLPRGNEPGRTGVFKELVLFNTVYCRKASRVRRLQIAAEAVQPALFGQTPLI
jgi:hypothetical protein